MNTTITDKTILLSKKGMKELKKAIGQLERDRKKTMQLLREIDKINSRDETISRIEKLSNLESIEADLTDKRMSLSLAKLIPANQTRLQVVIGSVVDLIDRYGHQFRYKIVDTIEANPSDGRISALSPLGKSLLGKTVTDNVELTSGNKVNRFKLVNIF
jgi:transcription elongation factor GreA